MLSGMESSKDFKYMGLFQSRRRSAVNLYFAASWLFTLMAAPGLSVWAQEQEKPAIAPMPRTINLTQEQRYIIKENVKDLALRKAPATAPETIGEVVPGEIQLESLPAQAANKVPQARSHLFFVKEGNNTIILVSPNDRRIADVIH
jgi:hypothetical protein